MNSKHKYAVQLIFFVLIFTIAGILIYQRKTKGDELLNSLRAKYSNVSRSDSLNGRVVFIVVNDKSLIRTLPDIVSFELDDSTNWTLAGLPVQQMNLELRDVLQIGDRVIKNPDENWFIIQKTQVSASRTYKFELRNID